MRTQAVEVIEKLVHVHAYDSDIGIPAQIKTINILDVNDRNLGRSHSRRYQIRVVIGLKMQGDLL